MNRKRKILVLYCLLFLICDFLSAQNYNLRIDGLSSKNYVQTPEMSAIRKIALSSVNYSTGTVDIRIPLFSIKCGELTLPVYLLYNSTGIKVKEPSGWVGQNWILHAEPILTRNLRGHIDSGDINLDKDNTSYWWMRRYLNNNLLSSTDSEPDEYSFTLLEGGGMFMSGKSEDGKSKYVCLPYDDIEIPNLSSIRDAQGTIYNFGNGGIDRTMSPVIYVTSWHASSVVAANGIDTLLFKYDNKCRTNIERHEDHIVVVDDYFPANMMGYSGGKTKYEEIQATKHDESFDVEEMFRMPVIYKTFDKETNSYQMDKDHKLVLDGRVIDKVEYFPNISYEYQRLSEISFKGNRVVFTVDKNENLCSIIFRNNQKQIVKHFVLDYELSRDRYYLVNLKELSADGKVVSYYHLNYNNTGKVAQPGKRAYDFWGYNNSDFLHNDISLVPPMKLYINRYDSNINFICDSLTIGGDPYNQIKKVRHADEYYMQCGMLSSIEHPTGAKETFIWEANKARIEGKSNEAESSVFRITDELEEKNGIYTMGGLRIKEMNISENGECKLRRIFKYGEREDGAGATPMRDGFNYFVRSQTKIYNNSFIHQNLGYSKSRYRTLSSTPIVPFTYYNGAAVMYNMVTEYTYSFDKPVAKVVYRYKLPDVAGNDVLTGFDVWDFHIHNYDKWFSDYLCSKEIYKNIGTEFRLVSSDSYKYNMTTYPKVNYVIRGREYRNDYYENFSDQDLELINRIVNAEYKDYSVIPRAKLLVSHEHKEVMSNGVVMTELRTYGYNNPSDIRMTSLSISRGDDKYSIHTSYPSSINNGIYADMVKKNMLDYPVEERVERNGKVISARLMTYMSVGNCYYPNKMYTYTPGLSGCPFDSFSKFKGAEINNLYVPFLDIEYVDGRVGHLTNQQGITTYYTWDKARQYPIKEKKVGGKLIHESAFTYIPAVGMTSETRPNKDIISYSYDTAGRLSEIRDCNGKVLWKYLYKYISGNTIDGRMNNN